MTEITLIYSTFPTRDAALAAARNLLDQRLIACANVVDGITSLYRWEGELREEPEAVFIAKTSKGCAESAIAAIKALHSYEVPCIVVYPIEQGFLPFLQWVQEETAADFLPTTQ